MSGREESGAEGSSPATLYATVVGAVLTIAGIVGFFYSASFGSPGEVDKALGIFAVNGWHNVVHLVTGLLGLVAVGYAARQYAIGLGFLYSVIAIWGFVIGSGEAILGVVPVNGADNVLHLVIGLAGLAAGFATSSGSPAKPHLPKRSSELATKSRCTRVRPAAR